MDLCNIYEKDYISSKLQLSGKASPDTEVVRSPAPVTEACLEDPGVAQPPEPAAEEISSQHRHEEPADHVNDYDQEIEHLRHVEVHDERDVLPDFAPSPRFTPSRGREDHTPLTSQLLGSASVDRTIGTGVLPTPDLPASTGLYESEIETPSAFLQEQLGVENTGLSYVPELLNSKDAEVSYIFLCFTTAHLNYSSKLHKVLTYSNVYL